MIHLLFFGKLGDLAMKELGTSSLELTMPTKKESLIMGEVFDFISQKSLSLCAELKKPVNLIAINQRIYTDKSNNNINLISGDEIAFMSPLSGG